MLRGWMWRPGVHRSNNFGPAMHPVPVEGRPLAAAVGSSPALSAAGSFACLQVR